MKPPPPVVLIVDDDASVRKALARLIRSAGIDVETFALAEEVLARLARPTPGCLIADLQMPGLNGLELQAELTRRRVHMPIIFISGQGDIPSSVGAMKAGAVDFLTKPFDSRTVLAAVEQAILKDALLAADLHELEEVRRCFKELTPREVEVFHLVVAGKMNKQIAGTLGTVEATVKVHRARIMTKMQADSVARLVRLSEILKRGS
jgi:FixJ family two-component response regulator